MEFMPHNAPLVILTFLGACFGLGVLGLVVLYGSLSGKRELVKYACGLALTGVSLYGCLLVAFSLASTEKVLAAGEWKYFCEVDCHLAYAVTSVSAAKTLGAGEHAVSAQGTFYIVTLKTWFDEDTISRRRPRAAPLSPNLRWASVIDEQGRRFPTSLEGTKALEIPAGRNVPLTQWLRPGESYETTLVFDLPGDAHNPRLLLTDPLPLNWLLIGHENSFLHKKVYFRLAAQETSSGVLRP